MIPAVNEGASFRLSGILKDELGAALGSGSVGALTATLYDQNTNQIINGRDNQNVLNANGGTLDAQGNFSFLGTAADSVIATSTIVGSELHILLIQWVYQGGTKSGKQEFTIATRNLNLVFSGALPPPPTLEPRVAALELQQASILLALDMLAAKSKIGLAVLNAGENTITFGTAFGDTDYAFVAIGYNSVNSFLLQADYANRTAQSIKVYAEEDGVNVVYIARHT